jgi:hypothetical protein
MKILIELFWNYACASETDTNLITKYYEKKEIEKKLWRAGVGQSLAGQDEIWRGKDKNDWGLLASIAADNSEEIQLQDIEGDSVLVHGVDADRLGVKCTANLEMEFDLGSADEDDLKQALNDCAVLVLRIPIRDLLDHGCSQSEIDECIVIDGCLVINLEEWDSLTVCVNKI